MWAWGGNAGSLLQIKGDGEVQAKPNGTYNDGNISNLKGKDICHMNIVINFYVPNATQIVLFLLSDLYSTV